MLKLGTMARMALLSALVGLSPAALPDARAQQVLGIAAVVDDEVISAYDLEERLDLVITLANLPRTQETRRRIRPQVLRTLVDEELQKKAAREIGITVTNAEIDAEIEAIAGRNGLTGPRLIAQLGNAGVDEHALRQQVLAGLAWQRFMGLRLLRQVQVADEEIDEVIARQAEARGETSYLVSEILLTVESPSQEVEVREAAERLVRQVRGGARFDALARQFSDGATAQQGGDVGWIQQDQLGPEIAEVLPSLGRGDVSDPIRTATGYTIIGMRDTRIEGENEVSDVQVELTQILLPLGRDAPQPDVERAAATANDIRGRVNGCATAQDAAAGAAGSSVAELGTLAIGDLPDSFRNAIAALAVGDVSPPIRTAAGVHLLIVCDRSDPIDDAAVRARIENEILGRKLNQRALAFLRDLRRDTIVDYR